MPGKPRVLLTGSTGYLGSFLLIELRRRGVDVVTAGRGCSGRAGEVILDLADPQSIAAAISSASVDAGLNAAALSSVTACAGDPEAAASVNGRSPGLLAESLHGRCLHVSTDLVFDGLRAPYGPEDSPRPLSVYGSTKVEGEQAVLAAGGTVVRVPLLIGPSPDGRRGATDMLRSAIQAGRRLDLFTDEFRTPLHAADAARGLVDVLLDGATGTLHLAGHERLSRWELAQRLCALHGLPTAALNRARSQGSGRPADVSLVGVEPARSLDEALRDS